MKIIVQESGEKPIKIVLPTGLIFNPVTAMIAGSLMNKTLSGKLSKEDIDDAAELAESAVHENSGDVPAENDHPAEMFHISTRDMIRFCNEINRMKRIHGNLPLVDVMDDGGDGVKIYL